MVRLACCVPLIVLLAGVVDLAPRSCPLSFGNAYAQDAINHDSLMNDDIRSAGRAALMEDALKRAHGAPSGQTAGGSGPEVDLNIAFPPNQTGLDNVNVIRLVPVDPGAHEADALAQVRGTSIFSIFISMKDVRPGYTYIVVASDAVNDNYPVGQIHIGPGGQQVFNIGAPLLTPNSPQLQSGAPVYANVPPAQPGTPAEVMARDQREMPRWAMGVTVKAITPAMLATSGYPESHLRGFVVIGVVPGSPADRAGILVNDVVAKVNGRPCRDVRELAALTADRQRGAPTDLYIYSQRVQRVVTLRVAVDLTFVPPSLPGAYVPPQSGAGLVQPILGTGFAALSVGEFHPPVAGPGFVPPANGQYRPPQVGPGFQAPGTSPNHPPQAAAQGGSTDSKYGMRGGPPASPSLPNTGWKPPTTGPGFVAPGTNSGQTTTYHPSPPQASPVQPASHPVRPQPYHPPQPVQPNPLPQGSSQFKPPKTGPGFKQPGSN